MQPIDPKLLPSVSGGMRLDDLPLSDNVDDRRGLTRWQSMHVRRPPPPPLPHYPRYKGDLPSQAGLDDIDDFVKRNRNRKRR